MVSKIPWYQLNQPCSRNEDSFDKQIFGHHLQNQGVGKGSHFFFLLLFFGCQLGRNDYNSVTPPNNPNNIYLMNIYFNKRSYQELVVLFKKQWEGRTEFFNITVNITRPTYYIHKFLPIWSELHRHLWLQSTVKDLRETKIGLQK